MQQTPPHPQNTVRCDNLAPLWSPHTGREQGKKKQVQRSEGKKEGINVFQETAGWTSVMTLLGASGPAHFCTSSVCVPVVIGALDMWIE